MLSHYSETNETIGVAVGSVKKFAHGGVYCCLHLCTVELDAKRVKATTTAILLSMTICSFLFRCLPSRRTMVSALANWLHI